MEAEGSVGDGRASPDPDVARAWGEDTLCVVMSSTEGATAGAAHLLTTTGDLDLDERSLVDATYRSLGYWRARYDTWVR
jgi:hypothetical protein